MPSCCTPSLTRVFDCHWPTKLYHNWRWSMLTCFLTTSTVYYSGVRGEFTLAPIKGTNHTVNGGNDAIPPIWWSLLERIGFVEGALHIDPRNKFVFLYIFNVQHNMKICVKAICISHRGDYGYFSGKIMICNMCKTVFLTLHCYF